MYTLEQVIADRLYIHCPEEWQQKTMTQYAIHELNDTAWETMRSNIHRDKTCFTFARLMNGKCEMFSSNIDLIKYKRTCIIHFDDFDMNRNINGFDIDNFLSFLMEG